MKFACMFFLACVGMGIGFVVSAGAATWYLNDDSTEGDVYTSGIGHDGNSGTSPNQPKRTLNSLLTNAIAPGDVILVDTGFYAPAVVPNSTAGGAGAPIVFQGSTNLAAGGTVFLGSGRNVVEVRGRHLRFSDMTIGGGGGIISLYLNGAAHCEFEWIRAINSSFHSIWLDASNSNAFRRCVAVSPQQAFIAYAGSRGNYLENTVLSSQFSSAFSTQSPGISNVVGCIVSGSLFVGGNAEIPGGGTRNVFFPTRMSSSGIETVADLQREYTNWVGNTYADPMFANLDGLDFHLLSASGFVSNGVWVTNAAVGYSPGIDFGARE
jgi:hypothetical protein